MKTLKLEIPEGYEIDKEKSTFDNIILKKIEKKRPMSVKEIKGRDWYLTPFGNITKDNSTATINHVSSKERAEAFLALMQLVELRDAWNEGWQWENGEICYAINFTNDFFRISVLYHTQQTLSFKSRELAEDFLNTFRDLIETAKELI